MQFHIKNLNEETLTVVVYEMSPFAPDGTTISFSFFFFFVCYSKYFADFLGRAEVKLQDIYHELQNTNGPIIKKLILHQVESGEVVVKLDLQMFTNNY